MSKDKKEMKSGRKPIEDKPLPPGINPDDFFGSGTKVNDKLKAKLRGRGLEWRFVYPEEREKKYGMAFNQGWKPYMLEQEDKDDITEFNLGRDPQGYLRRGTNVLVVRKTEVGDYHRAALRKKADRQLKVDQVAASDLRRMASSANLKSVIVEGDEED